MDECSYEEFGAEFFRRAVTPERVADTVRRVAGEEINVGPIKVGPGGLATAQAVGRVQKVTATHVAGSPITYRVEIPVLLTLEVALAGQKHSFDGDLTLTLHLAARAMREPLQVVIDIEPIAARDIAVKTRAAGLQAKLLQRIGNMDEEIRDQVLRVVTELLAAPAAMEVRIIDVGKIIEDVWV